MCASVATAARLDGYPSMARSRSDASQYERMNAALCCFDRSVDEACEPEILPEMTFMNHKTSLSAWFDRSIPVAVFVIGTILAIAFL